MATIVLTAVGLVTPLGAIGGAIGSLIGNQIDRALLGPKGATGPRLGSLAVQSSSYGSEIPRVFGTMRLAGSVIWATDLKEDRHKSGGKGQPKTTTYSYSASFAVLLSARAIVRVERIWADGNLLRGSGGDWKSELAAFRLHTGEEGQAIDPLIAAAEGIDATFAHRGCAYAVFEGLQLGDFGNRIPSPSFEIVADEAPVTLDAIAADLSGGAVRGAGGPLLDGYAAGGDSVRGALDGLAQALPVAFAADGDGLRLVDETAAPIAIAAAELGTRAGDKRAPLLGIERAATGTLNEGVALAYYDPARDYQIGTQATRQGATGRRVSTIELPAAIDAGAARGFAADRLAREWAGRAVASVTLPPRRLDIATGAIATLPGQDGRWRVTRRGFEASAVSLDLVRLPGGGGGALPASAGRAVAQPDLAQGPTHLAVLDLPGLGDDPETSPSVLIAAAGEGAGWRRATLIGSLDGGASWTTIGDTAPGAVIGQAATLLGDAGAMLTDLRTTVEVELLHDGMALTGDDRLGWSGTANLAAIGDELVQFGQAEWIAPRRYRLSRLLRGRRGTEWASGRHAAGERFVLLDPETLVRWAVPQGAIGATLTVAATGLGDAVPATATLAFAGRSLLPPAPVALRGVPKGDGTLALGWTRRSRAGWAWRDGADAPIGEEAERYAVTLTRGGSVAVETAMPALVAAPPPGTGPVTVAIAQIGTFGASSPAATLILGD